MSTMLAITKHGVSVIPPCLINFIMADIGKVRNHIYPRKTYDLNPGISSGGLIRKNEFLGYWVGLFREEDIFKEGGLLYILALSSKTT